MSGRHSSNLDHHPGQSYLSGMVSTPGTAVSDRHTSPGTWRANTCTWRGVKSPPERRTQIFVVMVSLKSPHGRAVGVIGSLPRWLPTLLALLPNLARRMFCLVAKWRNQSALKWKTMPTPGTPFSTHPDSHCTL